MSPRPNREGRDHYDVHQPRRRAARQLVVLALASVIAISCHGNGSGGSRDELRRAANRSLDEPMLRSERRISGQGVLVEEFIAPDRVRSVLPPPDLAGFPDVSTLLIVVGDTIYTQDSYAQPPNNELFVACQPDQPGGAEVRGTLALVREAQDVRQVADDRYRFRLPDDLEIGDLTEARGQATVSRGRISELRMKLGDDEFEAVWSLTFDEVAPITAPADDQIVRRDCQTTPVGGTPGPSTEEPST